MPAGRRASGKGNDMFYITGDTHGQFGRIESFCERFGTSKDDVMIILGDAGINFSGGIRDRMKKEFLESLPITIFAIHGNHEQRPQTIDSYKEKLWHGGVVYYEEEYQSLLFAKDGEVFYLDGKQAIVMGGAYSIDKMVRLMYGYGWWLDGNGRTGRLILFRECLKNEIVPVVIEDANRNEYLEALKEYRETKQLDKMIELFNKEQQFYLEKSRYFM